VKNTGVKPLSLFKQKAQILFVCTENICRSPLAEGLARHYINLAGVGGAVRVKSAGTRVTQPGARPDQRAERIAASEGVSLARIRASLVTQADLIDSDYVFAMDRSHLQDLLEICPSGHSHKISLLLSHLPEQAMEDVPDPYYGSFDGFRQVYKLIETAVIAIVPVMVSPV
jgi:protein-tyrosine phosphatase